MNILEWIRSLDECRQKGIKVFSIPELMNLSGHSEATVRRTLVRLKGKGILQPLYSGLWGYGKDITLEDLFLKMDPDAYISFETVLGRANVIRSMSPDLHCASLSLSKVVKTNLGTIVFHRMKRDLLFGFDSTHYAFPEKALLDFIYVKSKNGAKIQFDQFDLSQMGKKKLKIFSARYPDFVRKTLTLLNSNYLPTNRL